MKILIASLLIIFSYGNFANAQNKMSIGAGVVVALPVGGFGDVAGTGFGGTAAFEIGFLPNLTGIGQIGYISWGGKEHAGYSYGYSAVPLTFGAKYFFLPGSGLYGTASLGFHFFSANAEVPSVSFGGQTFGGSVSGTTTDFTFVFGAGYEVPINSNFTLDFTGGFNLISSSNYLTVRAGGKMAL